MTRRPRRASSAPQRVGSDEGLASSRPPLAQPHESGPPDSPVAAAEPGDDSAPEREGEVDPRGAGTRHTPQQAEQSRDDTDEGWGESSDSDASARWLRENRPPHWD